MSMTWQLCNLMFGNHKLCDFQGTKQNQFSLYAAVFQLSFFPILRFHHSFFCLEAPVCNYYLWEGDSTSFCCKTRPEDFICRHPWTTYHKLYWGIRMHTCSLNLEGVDLLAYCFMVRHFYAILATVLQDRFAVIFKITAKKYIGYLKKTS